MLPARHRMRRPQDFTATVRAARAGNRILVVHATTPATRAGHPVRVGVVASKAVGNAVVRNRAKRRLRALLADRLPTLPAGLDLVVRANPGAAGTTPQALGEALDNALSRVLPKVGSAASHDAIPPAPPSSGPALPVP
ncbi:ribonuclease P protein component [Kineosphaera limosa NBRC 100340]|uniref:Ribonuclease P protein component n=1 Tax=Kineosphaera limosa NBRC 100340 TaxID=1184609 RepID=K6VGV0_9MICO|nr:ribonuclease P protein component [Kineosphaera limosa]GAB95413.1 ribonuclease P protein component [Kineosphaera limosa NBRC 100340]